MKTNTQVNELFLCQCANTEHQLIFSYDDDEKFPNVYVSVHLAKEDNFFKRLKNGLKYIFGHTSRYGHFDEFIFEPMDYPQLQKVVDHLKKFKEKK